MKQKLCIAVLLIMALIGTFVATHLTVGRYNFLAGKRIGGVYCNVSTWINCDAVAASPQAEIFGISNSSIALGFYLFLFVIVAAFFFSTQRKEREGKSSALRSLVLMSTGAGMVATLYFLWVSVFEVGAICISCSISYLVNTVAFVAAWILAEGRLVAALTLPFRWVLFTLTGKGAGFGTRFQLPALVVIGLICFALPITWDTHKKKDSVTKILAMRDQQVQRLMANRPIPLDTEGCPVKGAEKPKVTIVEYSDFLCPFCRKGAFLVNAVMHNYRDQARLVFRHFPLDNACNFRMQRAMHPFACALAKGGICAEEQGEFWKYHDIAFSWESKVEKQTPFAIAKEMGLDAKAFDTCMHASKTRRRLRKDIEDAYRAGVSGTPAFFFNGRPIAGLLPAPILQALIEASMKMADE